MAMSAPQRRLIIAEHSASTSLVKRVLPVDEARPRVHAWRLIENQDPRATLRLAGFRSWLRALTETSHQTDRGTIHASA